MHNMFRIRTRISHRLFAALFLVAVIPISIMGFGMYRAAQNIMIQSALMHVETIARNQASNLDAWFEERLNDIRILSELTPMRGICTFCKDESQPHVPASESKLLDASLALTRSKSNSYQSIHLLSPSGDILASTDASSEMLLTGKYLQDLRRLDEIKGPVLTHLHQHSNQRWYMHLVAPIHFREEKINGAILAILDASGTLDPIMTNRGGLGETGEAYLVNDEGKIVTESKYLSRDETRERPFITDGIRSALARQHGTGIYRNYMGQEVVGSYLWLPQYHWGLVAEIHKDEILAPLRGIRLAVFATAGAVSLLCILAAFLMSGRISRPIIEIADVSRNLAGGALDRRTTYRGQDEIGVLSENFNLMAERLSELVASLRGKEASLRAAYDDLLQTKEKLVQSEKMAAVGELVASVVHEMRNPLSSVKLNYQIIGRTLDRASPLHEHYAIGMDQISQLERMFSDLLDYSRPIKLEEVPFSIDSLIDKALQQLEPQLHGQIITRSGIDESLPQVLGDPGKMLQVLVNVIRNGLEAAGPGGEIRIWAALRQTGDRQQIHLFVADNGPGIPAQDLDRVFQPFFTTKKKGTGLGLAIVKKIMDAHGFGISVAGEEGRGAMVTLDLRVEDERSPGLPRPPEDAVSS